MHPGFERRTGFASCLLAEDENDLEATVRQGVAKSRQTEAIAAALVGIVVLGAILTIRMADGTVVVEGPSDGHLPEDVSILLSGGGKQLEISSAEKWKLSVQPGAYTVDIKGGSDTFEIKQHEISVKRFGQQIVKIVRQKVPETSPAATPVVPAVAGIPNRLAGRWQITEAENLVGEAYGGNLRMRVASSGVVELDWLDEQGNTVQTGVGLVEEGRLFAAWGVVPRYGFCLYKLLPEGKMEARWTLAGASGRLATESASGGTPGKLEGTYEIEGSPIVAGGRYKGTLTVFRQGETYAVEWSAPEGKYQGIGLRQGNYLAIAWSLQEAEGYGVVEYKLGKDTAEGRWTMIGQDRLSFEILKREAAK